MVLVSGLIPGTLVASLGPESSFPEGVAPLSLAGPTPSSEWACFFPIFCVLHAQAERGCACCQQWAEALTNHHPPGNPKSFQLLFCSCYSAPLPSNSFPPEAQT